MNKVDYAAFLFLIKMSMFITQLMNFSKQIVLEHFEVPSLCFNKEWIIHKSTVFQNCNRQKCHF